jgi:hypothetical protein
MKIVSPGASCVAYPDVVRDFDRGANSADESSSSLLDGSNLEPAVDGLVEFCDRKLFSVCLAVVGRVLTTCCDDFAVFTVALLIIQR